MHKEKIILDTEALLKNRKKINSLLSESDMYYCIFDFQIMLIHQWQFSLKISKLKWKLIRLRQNQEEGLALLELDLTKSRMIIELMKLEHERKHNESIMENIIGKDLLKRLTLPKELKYNIMRLDTSSLKVSGIKTVMVNKSIFNSAKEALTNYEEVYKTSLSSSELLNMLTYLTCGFKGNRFFLEIKKGTNKYEIPNTWSKFNLQLIKI